MLLQQPLDYPTPKMSPNRRFGMVARWFASSLAASSLAAASITAVSLTLVSPPATAVANEPDGAVVAGGLSVGAKQRIAADLEYLSSDALKGRDTGSEGIDIAADYIAARFKELGFNVELFDGGPFQEFTALTEVVAGSPDANGISFDSTVELPTLEMSKTMTPLAIGVSGEVSAPIVFVGYGITAPDQNYDDYAGIDATGKIVVVLRGEPRRGRDDNPFGGSGSSRYAFFATKIENAITHGAAALLIVNHAEGAQSAIDGAQRRLDGQQQQLVNVDESLEKLPEEAVKTREGLLKSRAVIESQLDALQASLETAPEALLSTSQAGQTPPENAIPVASIGRQTFSEMLETLAIEGQPQTLEAIEAQIDDRFEPASFELAGVTASLKTEVNVNDVRAKNVVGELPGVGPLANETVVIGAHYDHVGMGGVGSLAPGTIEIHNGADDNGSGTVTMLELARQIAGTSTESRRRVVFIAFTAEERGLLGSKHYAREPRFPLEDTTSMINLDMVGRLSEEEGLTVFGTGTASNFDAMVDLWNEEAELLVRKDVSGYGPSDHTSFYEKDVPVLFFFTGLHSDYHRPSDDFDKINLDGMVQITDMVYDAAMYLATVEERPEFQKTGPGNGVGRNRRGAYLGVQLRDEEKGVFVAETVEGAPAASAGLLENDQIVRIGDTDTQSTEDVQSAMSRLRPGRNVPVVIKRGGDEITIQVRPTRRP